MAGNWESKLQRLQTILESHREIAGIDLYYGVVHLRGAYLPSENQAGQTIYAAGGTLVESLVLSLNPNEHQLHLVFATDRSEVDSGVLKHFKSQLRDFRDLASSLPQRVLPASRVPPMTQRADEDFVRWGLSLIWLGATEQKVFHNQVEYFETASMFRDTDRIRPWDQFSPVSGFDPIAMLTMTESSDRGWTYWNQEHMKARRTFPEVIAASLTKPLFYASINAVDLLIQRGREQRPVRKKVKVADRKLCDGSTLDPTESLVLGELRRHHGTKDAPCCDPTTQKKIAEQLNVSQPTVGRALKGLLNRIPYLKSLSVKKRYHNLCRDNLIVDVLDQIENPRPKNEFESSTLESFDDDNRRY